MNNVLIIIQIVCDYFKIHEEELRSNVHIHGGAQIYTKPIFIIWYFCEMHTRTKEKTNHRHYNHSIPYKQMAAIMGRKSHCDVIYAIRIVENQIETNAAFRKEINELSIIINNQLYHSMKHFYQYAVMALSV